MMQIVDRNDVLSDIAPEAVDAWLASLPAALSSRLIRVPDVVVRGQPSPFPPGYEELWKAIRLFAVANGAPRTDLRDIASAQAHVLLDTVVRRFIGDLPAVEPVDVEEDLRRTYQGLTAVHGPLTAIREAVGASEFDALDVVADKARALAEKVRGAEAKAPPLRAWNTNVEGGGDLGPESLSPALDKVTVTPADAAFWDRMPSKDVLDGAVAAVWEAIRASRWEDVETRIGELVEAAELVGARTARALQHADVDRLRQDVWRLFGEYFDTEDSVDGAKLSLLCDDALDALIAYRPKVEDAPAAVWNAFEAYAANPGGERDSRWLRTGPAADRCNAAIQALCDGEREAHRRTARELAKASDAFLEAVNAAEAEDDVDADEWHEDRLRCDDWKQLAMHVLGEPWERPRRSPCDDGEGE